jgi:hypothetical protein
MEHILQLFTDCIDWTLVLIIVLSSFWVKKNFSEILPAISTPIKILLWSTLVSTLYYYVNFLTGIFQLKDVACYMVTYFFATSFYEIIAKPILSMIQKYIGNGSDTTDEG